MRNWLLNMEEIEMQNHSDGEEMVETTMTSTRILTGVKTFHQSLVKQPQAAAASELGELVSTDVLKAMLPNVHKISYITYQFQCLRLLRREVLLLIVVVDCFPRAL